MSQKLNNLEILNNTVNPDYGGRFDIKLWSKRDYRGIYLSLWKTTENAKIVTCLSLKVERRYGKIFLWALLVPCL
jgi:hypothetical protein